MYYIYLNQFNIIISRYSCTAPTNEDYLDSWRFINVILIITVISAYVFYKVNPAKLLCRFDC